MTKEEFKEVIDGINKEIDQREKDIQSLCDAVVQISPISTGDSGSGAMCPFCYCGIHWNASNLSDGKHKPDCAYLIAKDLSTGFKN